MPHPAGFLPYWLAFTGILSLNSTVITYFQQSPTLCSNLYRRAQPGQVTSLSSRNFGMWCLLSSIVRFYASYDITSKSAFDLGFWSFLVGILHFGAELLVFGTVGGASLYMAEMTPFVSIIWMWAQRKYYLGL